MVFGKGATIKEREYVLAGVALPCNGAVDLLTAFETVSSSAQTIKSSNWRFSLLNKNPIVIGNVRLAVEGRLISLITAGAFFNYRDFNLYGLHQAFEHCPEHGLKHR